MPAIKIANFIILTLYLRCFGSTKKFQIMFIRISCLVWSFAFRFLCILFTSSNKRWTFGDTSGVVGAEAAILCISRPRLLFRARFFFFSCCSSRWRRTTSILASIRLALKLFVWQFLNVVVVFFAILLRKNLPIWLIVPHRFLKIVQGILSQSPGIDSLA